MIPTNHLNEQRKENLEKQYENITNLLEKSRQKCKDLENYIKKQDEQFSKIIKKNHKYKTMIKKRLKKWKTDFQTYEKVKTMIKTIVNCYIVFIDKNQGKSLNRFHLHLT